MFETQDLAALFITFYHLYIHLYKNPQTSDSQALKEYLLCYQIYKGYDF